MNDITKKIRGYSRRQPVTEKKFKFSNDLLARAAYVGNGKNADKRFDLATEGLLGFFWAMRPGAFTVL